MPLELRLDSLEDQTTLSLDYRRLHILRKKLIVAAIDYLTEMTDDAKRELQRMDEEDDMDVTDEEMMKRNKARAEQVGHARDALKEIQEEWLVDVEKLTDISNPRGKKGKALEEAQAAAEKLEQCVEGIDYDAIPGHGRNYEKDNKAWVVVLGMLGLVQFVSHSDCQGYYTPGQALDISITISILRDHLTKKLVSQDEKLQEYNQEIIEQIDGIRNLCAEAAERKINILFA